MNNTEPLTLLGPVRVATVLKVGDRRGTIALHINPPTAEWIDMVFQALKGMEAKAKKAKDEAAKALDELFGLEKLADFVTGWEGVGGLNEAGQAVAAPFSREALVAVCRAHPHVLAFLRRTMKDLRAREVEKNSEASPVGPTVEAENPAPSAGSSPSGEG